MGKVIDLKKEGSTDWTEKESFEYIHQYVRDFYMYSEEEGSEPSEDEMNGFEVGLISYLINEDKGRLPVYIKNINVEAIKAYERTARSFPEVEVLPQKFYIGYIKGFCRCYEL